MAVVPFNFQLWEIISKHCQPATLIALAKVGYSMNILVKMLSTWEKLKYDVCKSTGLNHMYVQLFKLNFWKLKFREQCLILTQYPVTANTEQCWEFICSSQLLLEVACTLVWKNNYNPAEQWPYVIENYQIYQLKDGTRTSWDWDILPSGSMLPPPYSVGLSWGEVADFQFYASIAQVVECFSKLLFNLEVVKVKRPKLPPVSPYYFDLPSDDGWSIFDPDYQIKHVDLCFPTGLRIPYVKTQMTPVPKMLCPTSDLEILLPVRSIHCNHTECFDLKYFVRLARETQVWRCPICNADLRSPNKLFLIDAKFLDML